jgi:hypothetical protein
VDVEVDDAVWSQSGRGERGEFLIHGPHGRHGMKIKVRSWLYFQILSAVVRVRLWQIKVSSLYECSHTFAQPGV